jgi:GT2 family glycosyltransferase
MTSDLTVIIVNYKTDHHTLELTRTLYALGSEQPSQLIIVDNSPVQGLGKKLNEGKYPLEYIPCRQNLGFAGGVNQGLSRAEKDIIILINPDARPEPGCLKGLAEILRADQTHGVAGPRLLPFSDGAPQVPSATWIDPSLLTTLVEYTALHRFFPHGWLMKNYFVNPESLDHPVFCAMVQGACFAIHRDWLKKTGPLDDQRFFLYWEETDFCRRVRTAGGKVLFCPQLICRHLGGASIPDGSQDIGRFWRSFYAYHRKYGGLKKVALIRLLLLIGMAAEYYPLRIKYSVTHQNDVNAQDYLKTLRSRLRQQVIRGGHPKSP